MEYVKIQQRTNMFGISNLILKNFNYNKYNFISNLMKIGHYYNKIYLIGKCYFAPPVIFTIFIYKKYFNNEFPVLLGYR